MTSPRSRSSTPTAEDMAWSLTRCALRRPPVEGASPASIVPPQVPAPARGYVGQLLAQHAVDLRLSQPRRTKLGDHQPPAAGVVRHRITVNEDLNPYAFLTTLLHEIAHAATWQRHRGRRRLRPHGREWQQEFGGLLRPILAANMVPPTVATALAHAVDRPAAATCSDRRLLLALAEFDPPPVGHVRVEDLAEQALFRVAGGGVFRAGRMVRSRRACFDLSSGREYRLHGLALVEPLAEPPRPHGVRRRRAT